MATLRFIGPEERWFETAVTGSQQSWLRGQTGFVADANVSAFLATGKFERYEREDAFLQAKQVVDKTGQPISTAGGVSFTKTATAELSSQLAEAAIDGGGIAASFIKDGKGMPLFGHIYRPKSAAEADVRACFAAANTLSGPSAVVDVRGMQITLTLAGGGPIVPWHGLRVLGHWGRWFAPGVLDGEDIVVTGGTEFICGEALPANKFNCFDYNGTDEPTEPTYPGGNITGLLQAALVGFVIEGVTFTGFRNGIKIGAKWKAGAHQCHFRNIHARSCTEWGFYLENFQNCTGKDFMVIANNLGQLYLGSANATTNSGSMNYGNSRFENIFANMGGGSGNGLRRGVWLRGRTNGGELNDIYISKIQVNSDYSRKNTDTVTLNPSSADIVVGNPSLYEVGSHLCFSTSVGGLKALANYIVRSKTGSTIQVAGGLRSGQFATFVASSGIAANTTATAITCGYPLLQVSGEDGCSVVAYIDGLDLENGAQSAVYADNAHLSLSGAKYLVGPSTPRASSQNMATLVCRAASAALDLPATPVFADIDSNSRVSGNVTLANGSSLVETWNGGCKPIGVHSTSKVDTNDSLGLSIPGAMVVLRNTGTYSLGLTEVNSLRHNETRHLLHRVKGSSNESWLQYERTGLTALTGPSGTTYTLPMISNADTGQPEQNSGDPGKHSTLCNSTANSITVTLDAAAIAAGQTIRGGGVSGTSFVLPAYTTIDLYMSQTGTGANQRFYTWR